jgi:pilus assembly protein TadC
MDIAAIPAFAGLTAGMTVFFLLYAIYSPIRPTRARTIAEDVFGEGGNPPTATDTAGRYARPLLDNFMPSLPENLVSKSSGEKYETLLRVSGNPLKINPEELFVLQIISGAIGLIIGLGMSAFVIANSLDSVPPALLPIVFVALAFYLPYAYHISLRDSRAKDVQKNLPEALDLLQVVMATGSTFQPALRRVTSQLSDTFLREEFTRMHVELKAGATLEHSLNSFADSNTSEEATAFASAIIQTQKLGANVEDTLERQAALTRANHEARIEKMIARLQTTLFVPISAFMMPAFLVIFLAPTLTNLTTALG